MYKFISLIFILLLILPGFPQQRDRGIFTNGAVYDTLGTSDDSLVTQIIQWKDWSRMLGTFKIYGKMWLLSGTSKTITVKLTPINDINNGYPGYTRTLGTRTVVDSTIFEFNVSGESWWNVQQGYKVSFVPSATGSAVRIRAKELGM